MVGRGSESEMVKHANLDADSYLTLLSDLGLLAVLFISIIGTMGNNVVSPALPAVTSALAVSKARVGLLITAYTLPAMVFVPLTSTVADMYGRRTVILPALVVFGAAGTALAGANTFQTMLFLRTVQGAAVAGFMPLTVTLLGDLYSDDMGATAQGLRVGANGIGGIVVPFVAGALAGLVWNYPFLLYTVAFLAFGFGCIFLPETTGGIEVDTETDVTSTFAWYARSLWTQLTERDLAVLLTGGFARDFPRYAVITFVPLFAVQTLGASFVEAGAILSIRGFISFFVSPFAGSLSEQFSHKWVLLGAISVSAGGILFVAAAPDLIWLAMAVGVYSVGDAAFSPVVKDSLTDATTDEYRSGVVGGMQLVKYSAQTASPAVFGLILAVSGFDVLFACAATVAGAYAIVVLMLFERD